VRKAQNIDALEFTLTVLLTSLLCDAATLDQVRLGWVQCHTNISKALPQCLQERFGFMTLFAAYDAVIDVPDETDISQTLTLTPSVRP
jgi:hypothetical protein